MPVACSRTPVAEGARIRMRTGVDKRVMTRPKQPSGVRGSILPDPVSMRTSMGTEERNYFSSSSLRGSPIAARLPPGWTKSLQSWPVVARRPMPDEPLADILPLFYAPRNRKRRDLHSHSLFKSPSLADNDLVVYGREVGAAAILVPRTPIRSESLYSSNWLWRHRRESGKSKGCGRSESHPIPKQAFAGSNPVTRSRSRIHGHQASD
jgi:hypothetical protein